MRYLDQRELLARLRGELQGDRKPWVIQNKAGIDGPAHIRIYSELGIWGVTADEIGRELDQVTADHIIVSISSPGGDVFSGIAIYNALRNHPARITTRVDGLAASIASVVVQAGDTREMVSSSQLMIHNAWGLMIGDSNDMRDMATLLEKQNGVIAGVYADRSRRGSVATWKSAMTNESWYDASEAVAVGLADRIRDPSQVANLTPSDRQMMDRVYREIWEDEIEDIANQIALEELYQNLMEGR